ncbi:hypothetical protein [Streptomyces olivoreticuli]|uniref:hypothetical protein n=1 Tax=Streptomyces olivoreticuli TaxID=68246 RepID=UPI000E267384|nr:hypothetical protein [Streptomyces olivoreticuli]
MLIVSEDERSQLAVDGDQVAYTCAQGTSASSGGRGSGHVRQAIARTQAGDNVPEQLHVADAHLPADADPAKFHPARTARP